jgi:hypothetical protein
MRERKRGGAGIEFAVGALGGFGFGKKTPGGARAGHLSNASVQGIPVIDVGCRATDRHGSGGQPRSGTCDGVAVGSLKAAGVQIVAGIFLNGTTRCWVVRASVYRPSE